MALTRSDARELFASECSFPARREAVVEAVGDAEVAAPNGEAVAVATVLERSEERRYESATELHSTLLANLDEDHVGRKRYDDRSTDPARTENVSF
ncbi:MAG: hypothetical protein ABEJ61_10505 [Haloferacaceae archaeon]